MSKTESSCGTALVRLIRDGIINAISQKSGITRNNDSECNKSKIPAFNVLKAEL